MKLVLGLCLLFLTITPLYGVKNSGSYLQSVMKHYFDVTVPENILQKKKIHLVVDFLKKSGFEGYQKEKCSDLQHSYYGSFQFEKDGPPLLWLYTNYNVHHGALVILNSNLDVIYFDHNMGCLYDLQLNDLMNDGSMVLMVTHGAGGAGVYAKLTDLIKNNEAGIPELKISLLNELTNHNISTGSDVRVCIKCCMHHQDFQFTSHRLDNGRVAPLIEINAEATLDSKVTPEERVEIKQFLKTEYGLELNKTKRGEASILLEDLDAPVPIITDRSSKRPICRGYQIPGEERWPLNLRPIEKD